MKVIVDLCVVPMGVCVSVGRYVVECQNVLKEAGLIHHVHAYGTNIEGDWDEVFAAVKRCHVRVHEMGAPRITTSIKVGTRTDREQSMQDKIDSVTKMETWTLSENFELVVTYDEGDAPKSATGALKRICVER